MALADRAELAVRLTLDDRAFTGGLRRSQSALGRFGSSAGRVGRGIGQIGTGLARAGLLVGGAAVAGIAGVAKAAIDFEDAFAGVKKTVNETDLFTAGSSFEALRQQILTMSTEIPIAATELARLGEVAGALGVEADSIDEFIRVTALLGVTTDLTSDQAAESLGKVGTILGLTGKEYQSFADILVNLGNQGASTESEILEMTKRFAATGEQAGLKAEEILALASSLASMGIEAEAGGGALSRIFANMGTEIANASDKGKAFADITGDSIKELQRRIDQGDALGILMDTLEGLEGLSRTEALTALKDLGITDTRNRNAIIAMANNLEFVNDQLDIAGMSTGALEAEATKRFDTIASKLDLVRGNALRVAIAMGDEFIPAIGRASDRLIEFLQKPGTLEDARNLGKDIGKFIDGIDWNKVADGANQLKTALKSAADFALLMLKAFDTLPTEVKGLLVGGAILNKLSGGLLGAGAGNIIGGLGEGIIRAGGSKVPGIGKLFAQPVFVTNWPPGMGLGGAAGGKGFFGRAAGGLGAALGGGAALGAAAIAASGAGLAALLTGVQKLVVEPGLQREAGENIGSVQAVIASGDLSQMQSALDGVRAGVANLDPLQRILYDLNADGVRVHTESLVGALERGITAAEIGSRNQSGSPDERMERSLAAIAHNTRNLQPLPDNISKKQKAQFERIRNRAEANRIATVTAGNKTTTKLNAAILAQRQTKAATIAKLESAKSTIASAERNAAHAIVGAIRALDLSVVVNVDTTRVYKTGQTIIDSGGTSKRRAGGGARRS